MERQPLEPAASAPRDGDRGRRERGGPGASGKLYNPGDALYINPSTTPARQRAASMTLSTTSTSRAFSTTTCRRSTSSTRTPRTKRLMAWLAAAISVPAPPTLDRRSRHPERRQRRRRSQSGRHGCGRSAEPGLHRAAEGVSQLYATEDPEVAAKQSLAAVRDISLSQPDMIPLSALFNVATIGGANVLKGYQGQRT